MGDAAGSAEAFLSVVLGGGKHEAIVGRDLSDTFGPCIKLVFVGQTNFGLDEQLVLLVLDQLGDGEDWVVDFELLLVVFGRSGGFRSHGIRS